MEHSGLFVLGFEVSDDTVIVLCRSRGEHAGPAYCNSVDDAAELRKALRLRAQELQQDDTIGLVSQMQVYCVRKELCDLWYPNNLWLSCDTSYLKEVEAQILPFQSSSNQTA